MAEGETPHVAAFEKQFNYMVDSIDAGSVAPAALSEGLIADRQRDECLHEQSSYKKAELLLGYIRRAISGQHDNFFKFVRILRNTGHSTQATQLGEINVLVKCFFQNCIYQ